MRAWSEIAATDRQRQSTNQKLQVVETRNISPLKTEMATDGKRVAGTDRKITAARASNRISKQSTIHRTNQEDEHESRELDEAKI